MINRGNARQRVFHKPDDCKAFAGKATTFLGDFSLRDRPWKVTAVIARIVGLTNAAGWALRAFCVPCSLRSECRASLQALTQTSDSVPNPAVTWRLLFPRRQVCVRDWRDRPERAGPTGLVAGSQGRRSGATVVHACRPGGVWRSSPRARFRRWPNRALRQAARSLSHVAAQRQLAVRHLGEFVSARRPAIR